MLNQTPAKPIVIGIVGGIASGKSLVAHVLQEMGGKLLDADRIAHSLVEKNPIKQSLIESFGTTDRQALAKIVFGDPQQLKKLEAILHPAVRTEVDQSIQTWTKNQDDATPWIVLDAPLLIEAGWADLCDRIIFVETSLELRRENARRRNWSDEELHRREQHQLPLDTKKNLATDIVYNWSDPEELKRQVLNLHWIRSKLPG